MIRIQAQPDRIDPAEEKKKTRENVLANVATFALLVVLIRSGKLGKGAYFALTKSEIGLRFRAKLRQTTISADAKREYQT